MFVSSNFINSLLSSPTMKRQNIKTMLKLAGGKAELARKLNVAPPYVYRFCKEAKIPVTQCRKIEIICKGEVTAEMLRPDIFSPSWATLTSRP